MNDTVSSMHYTHLVNEVRKFVESTDLQTVVIGLSGGIDSALTAVLAVDALGEDRVFGVALPGPYSTHHSLQDAERLANNLSVHFRTVNIRPIFQSFMGELELSGKAEENLQARIRGTVLMSLANQEGHLVLNTGNRSEALMGYCTMYGDTVGAFAPLANSFKTGVYALARYRNSLGPVIPLSTLEKPPSAELAPGQMDTDALPPYETLDPFLQAYVGGASFENLRKTYGEDFANPLIRRIIESEWKRAQGPPGPTPLKFPNRRS